MRGAVLLLLPLQSLLLDQHSRGAAAERVAPTPHRVRWDKAGEACEADGGLLYIPDRSGMPQLDGWVDVQAFWTKDEPDPSVYVGGVIDEWWLSAGLPNDGYQHNESPPVFYGAVVNGDITLVQCPGSQCQLLPALCSFPDHPGVAAVHRRHFGALSLLTTHSSTGEYFEIALAKPLPPTVPEVYQVVSDRPIAVDFILKVNLSTDGECKDIEHCTQCYQKEGCVWCGGVCQEEATPCSVNSNKDCLPFEFMEAPITLECIDNSSNSIPVFTQEKPPLAVKGGYARLHLYFLDVAVCTLKAVFNSSLEATFRTPFNIKARDCPLDCSKHGVCRSFGCLCDDLGVNGGSYGGDDCSVCKEGWKGRFCDQPCPPSPCNPCNGHGTCYADPSGELARCACNNSDHNGYWAGRGCDDCMEGYYGGSCTKKCPGYGTPEGICSGHGRCNGGPTGDGTCTCESQRWDAASNCSLCANGWWDTNCTRECNINGVACCGHGQCDTATGKCQCDKYWGSSHCCSVCHTVGTVECGGHGTCNNGVCECDTNWAPPNCTECIPTNGGVGCVRPCDSSGSSCSGHGRCTKSSLSCECDNGYSGATCSVACPGADQGNPCYGHGTCNSGTCTCQSFYDPATHCRVCSAGYVGPDCQVACPATANGVCNNQGHCYYNATKKEARCICTEHYLASIADRYCGPKCEQTGTQFCVDNCDPLTAYGPACKDHCHQNCISEATAYGCHAGQQGTGVCVCKEGFGGSYCHISCPTSNGFICSGNGYCGPDGQCECLPGFATASCSKLCPKLCSGHGSCSDTRTGTGKCTCDKGWTGEDCSVLCPGFGVNGGCSGHGNCTAGLNGVATCSCHDGWMGDTCDECQPGRFGYSCEKECQNGEAVQGGHGCTCRDDRWAGEMCEIPCFVSANGVCDGHGTCNKKTGECECYPGYSGANCTLVCEKCSANSYCNRDAKCECYQDEEKGYWAGVGCHDCLAGYWGSNCTLKCQCANGVCDKRTGSICQCFLSEDMGYWSGQFCDRCHEDYLGENCTVKNVVNTPEEPYISPFSSVGRTMLLDHDSQSIYVAANNTFVWFQYANGFLDIPGATSEDLEGILLIWKQASDKLGLVAPVGGKYVWQTFDIANKKLDGSRKEISQTLAVFTAHEQSLFYLEAASLRLTGLQFDGNFALFTVKLQAVSDLAFDPDAKVQVLTGKLLSNSMAQCAFEVVRGLQKGKNATSGTHTVNVGGVCLDVPRVLVANGYYYLAVEQKNSISMVRVKTNTNLDVVDYLNSTVLHGDKPMVTAMTHDPFSDVVYVAVTDHNVHYLLRVKGDVLVPSGITKRTDSKGRYVSLAAHVETRTLFTLVESSPIQLLPFLMYTVVDTDIAQADIGGNTVIGVIGEGLADIGVKLLVSGRLTNASVLNRTFVVAHAPPSIPSGLGCSEVKVSLGKRRLPGGNSTWRFTTSGAGIVRTELPEITAIEPTFFYTKSHGFGPDVVTVRGRNFLDSAQLGCRFLPSGDSTSPLVEYHTRSLPADYTNFLPHPTTACNNVVGVDCVRFVNESEIVCAVPRVGPESNLTSLEVTVDGQAYSRPVPMYLVDHPFALISELSINENHTCSAPATDACFRSGSVPVITIYVVDRFQNKLLQLDKAAERRVDLSFTFTWGNRTVTSPEAPSSSNESCSIPNERGTTSSCPFSCVNGTECHHTNVTLTHGKFASPLHELLGAPNITSMCMEAGTLNVIMRSINLTSDNVTYTIASGTMNKLMWGTVPNEIETDDRFSPSPTVFLSDATGNYLDDVSQVDSLFLTVSIEEYRRSSDGSMNLTRPYECSRNYRVGGVGNGFKLMMCPDFTAKNCMYYLVTVKGRAHFRGGGDSYPLDPISLPNYLKKCRPCEDGQGVPLFSPCYEVGCRECSKGAVCTGGETVYPLPGYWMPKGTYNFYQCDGVRECPGGPEMRNGACPNGTSGVLCSVCEEGYAKEGTTCRKCEQTKGKNALLVIVLVLGILIFSAYSVYTLQQGISSEKSVILRMTFSHLQLLSGIRNIGVPWHVSDMYTVLYDVFIVSEDSVGFDSRGFHLLNCKLRHLSVIGRFLFTMSTPLVSLFIGLLAFGLSRFLAWREQSKGAGIEKGAGWTVQEEQRLEREEKARKEGKKMTLANQLSSYKLYEIFIVVSVVVIFLLYQMLCYEAGKHIRCRNYAYAGENGQVEMIGHLEVARQIDCSTADYDKIYFAAVVFLFGYGVGLPGLLCFAVVHYRKHHSENDTKKVFSFLLGGFRGGVFKFWQMVVMLRKLAFVLVLSFISPEGTAHTRVYVTMWVLTFFLALQIWMQPFSRNAHNNAESYSLAVLVVTLNIGLFFFKEEDGSPIDRTDKLADPLIIIATILNLSVFVLFAYLFVDGFRRDTRRRLGIADNENLMEALKKQMTEQAGKLAKMAGIASESVEGEKPAEEAVENEEENIAEVVELVKEDEMKALLEQQLLLAKAEDAFLTPSAPSMREEELRKQEEERRVALEAARELTRKERAVVVETAAADVPRPTTMMVQKRRVDGTATVRRKHVSVNGDCLEMKDPFGKRSTQVIPLKDITSYSTADRSEAKRGILLQLRKGQAFVLDAENDWQKEEWLRYLKSSVEIEDDEGNSEEEQEEGEEDEEDEEGEEQRSPASSTHVETKEVKGLLGLLDPNLRTTLLGAASRAHPSLE